MNVLKNLVRNRLLAAGLLVGAAVASTGCDELTQLRMLLSLATPGIQSPLAAPSDSGLFAPGDPGSFDDFGGDWGDEDFWF